MVQVNEGVPVQTKNKCTYWQMFAFGRVGRCCCCYDLVQLALAVCVVASLFLLLYSLGPSFNLLLWKAGKKVNFTCSKYR